MREIEFRGKRVDNGEWVYGYYLKHETRQISPIGEDKLSDDEVMHLIARDGFADWNMPIQIEFVKVDPKTVGQYTGLKDKNGVKIYEWDYVNDGNETLKATVYYDEEQCQFLADYSDGYEPQVLGDWCVVIGNIHDDLELLEVK